MTDEEVARLVLARLSEEERSRSVVYLYERSFAPGEEFEVDGARVPMGAPTSVAFVDLEPGVNWGHRARYVFVDRASGATRTRDAQLPPFLRGMPAGLKVVYRSPGIPDWAVAGTKR